MPTIGARLKNDGTLQTAGELDEYNATPNQHRITVDNIIAYEFDETSLDDATPSGGSLQFNGSTQQLLLSGAADFSFGTNDFTIEGWFYTRSTAYQRLWCFPNGDNVEIMNTNIYYWNGSSIPSQAGSGTLRLWSWFHIALVRLDGVVTVYYNGTAVITESDTPNSSSSRPLAICGELPSDVVENGDDTPGVQDGWFDGYMTNFRIRKGTAAYTDDFNISYAPLTAESNTKLLLTVANKAGMIADTSGTSKTVSNVGGAVYDGSSPLSTATNGVMKQLKTGTLQVTNEFDEYIGGAGSIS
jgi:hypothetical protein